MSGPRTLIIGSSGMLGRELVNSYTRRGINVEWVTGRGDLDITIAPDVHRVLGERKPRVVINAAAYTNVDKAEAEPEIAEAVNSRGPAHLAETCGRIGALLVHLSTDYVFDGRSSRPYRVEDEPAPVNVYGRTKLAGERAVAAGGCAYLILRTSWLFASQGQSFVQTILRLARERDSIEVVDDQHGRPTYAADLAEVIVSLIQRGSRGIFHAANQGSCTWYDLARLIVELADSECEILPCTTADLPRPAPRPPFSVLDLSDTIAAIGAPRHWKEALATCVGQLMDDAVARPGVGNGI